MLLSDSITGLSEEHMMSQRSKRELFAEIQPRYLKAKKAKKQKILDEFTAATGYHRKYAVRVLKHGYKHRLSKPKGRTAVYRGAVVDALEEIWEIYGRIAQNAYSPTCPRGLKCWSVVENSSSQPRLKNYCCASAVQASIVVLRQSASKRRMD